MSMKDKSIEGTEALMFSYRSAARKIDVSVPTIRRLVRAGKIRAVRFSGTLVRIPAEELHRFIQQSLV